MGWVLKPRFHSFFLLVLILTGWTYAAAISVDDATWFTAQAQLGYNQAVGLLGTSPAGLARTAGVTIFPMNRAVTTPQGCIHYNGSTNGYSTIPFNVSEPQLTEYVARVKANTTYITGKASSDNCAACNNVCPCANGTSWGFFPFNNQESSAALVLNPPSKLDYSSPSTTFDILLQPSPDAGFTYSWVNLSSVGSLTGNSNYLPLSYNNVAPCCVPMNDALNRSILADDAAPADPSMSFRTQGAYPRGSFMGFCNLATGTASFTWYLNIYTVNMQNGSSNAQVLIMNATASNGNLPSAPASPAPGSQMPSFTVDNGVPPLQPHNLLFQVTENVTAAMPDASHAFTSQDGINFQAPGGTTFGFNGCFNNVVPGDTTSLPGFPIVGNSSFFADRNATTGVPPWYLPSSDSPVSSTWYPALALLNQTVGRSIPGMPSTWVWGRAFSNSEARQWTGLFPVGSSEFNTSRVLAPANFYVLGANNTWLDNQGYPYDAHHTFTYGSTKVGNVAQLEKGTVLVQLGGNVPCCINSTVPTANASSTTPIGNVMGVCNPSMMQANITWLGAVYPQDINQASLLTISVKLRPDPNRTAKIVGGVVGGVGGLLLILLLCLIAWWSRRTYEARARKRLIQDQVYNLVMGVCSSSPGFDDVMSTDLELQGAVNIDRFYNLLPFVNRMPRNKFYAKLSSKVAGRCMEAWKTSPKAAEGGPAPSALDARFRGYASQALAYSIMKHETSWANTDRAIVEQWQSGTTGRRKLVEDICDTLRSPELGDFLEGMDPTVENPPPMRSKGFLTTLSRLFFFTVPSYRVSYKDANPVPENNTLSRKDSDHMTSYQSMSFENSGPTSGTGSGKTGPTTMGLTSFFHKVGMDDYEIKPTEIELMTNADGSVCILGRGGFGQVCKARYNGVQLVAVKQLLEGGDDKAKLDFLREVAIMKKLRAENVVRFLGVCVKDGKTMLVTEFMAGGDLYKRLSETEPGGELAWHNLGRRIAVDIARGLAFLHSQNIVHLDFKSPNILLARDNTAKITDVGLARLTTADPVTHMSDMRGTLAWTAPEILRQTKGSFSTKADIYSFGVVLWEIVTGQSPHWGTNWYRTPRVPEECPAWVAELIEHCMLEDPLARPTSKDIYRMLLDQEHV